MGYTHYWQFVKTKGKAKDVEAAYQKAILDCGKLAIYYNQLCREQGMEQHRLSGYTAHCKPGQYGGVKLNGKGELAHEDFILREHFSQNFEAASSMPGFNFCKTAQKPYDIVITACLAILKYRLGDAVRVSSDGDAQDFQAGIALAKLAIRRKIKCPL
jgi:hypothetical protein